MQKTLVLLKPDCVERRLIGEIIGRLERKGLNVIAMKMLRITPAMSKQHYAEHVSKPFYPNLEDFITSSPIVAMAVEGLEVIRVVREMLGATNGLKAAPGTDLLEVGLFVDCRACCHELGTPAAFLQL